MYSPIENVGNMTSNTILDELPNFLNFVLLPTFDPADNYDVTHSYSYNELHNNVFNHYLKSIESKNVNKSNSRTIITNTNKLNFVKRHSTEIGLLFKTLLHKTTLSSKHGYTLKDYYLSKVYVNNSEKSWTFEAKLCVHKDDCAYGKVIDISLLHYVEKQITLVLNVYLFGVVPQEFISDIRGTFLQKEPYFIHPQNQDEHRMHVHLDY